MDRKRLGGRRGLAGLLALGLALGGSAGASEPEELSSEQRARLEEGQVLVSARSAAQNGGVSVRGIAVVEAPPSTVWPVVRDCEHFSEFMPRMRESQLLEREGPVSMCRIRVDMPFPFDDLISESRSTERDLVGGGFERSWALVRGDYERNEGSWWVLPWGDLADRTLLIYEQHLKPKFSVPEMMVRAGQRRTLPAAFRAIRQRVGTPDVAAGSQNPE